MPNFTKIGEQLSKL